MLRRLARPLLGLAFIDSGIAALRDDGGRAERARALGVKDPAQATRAGLPKRDARYRWP